MHPRNVYRPETPFLAYARYFTVAHSMPSTRPNSRPTLRLRGVPGNEAGDPRADHDDRRRRGGRVPGCVSFLLIQHAETYILRVALNKGAVIAGLNVRRRTTINGEVHKDEFAAVMKVALNLTFGYSSQLCGAT